ncbi:VOC family protein [Rhodobacter ferrooxidans]|uniref:3-demethylubiquinone-9 3-methyltransferase n=1 Tax=Rhodobacter ferrooxidans TaxID=371731 RepID=C8RXY5_9RHOB|nr:VOC family protein [Rhodobacter sp. SW2]EEW26383.1 3-demethylubiquinone-9 3-methyltransferase [Rhodobacter sp. SW2]
MTEPSLSTCLWFDTQAEAAARFYCSLFEGARITEILQKPDDPGQALAVYFDLLGQRYLALNGGSHYALTPAVSLGVHVDTQAEVDRLWDALLEGGVESRCGWLTDRFGLSWQITPRVLPRLLQTDTSGRVMQAMMGMVKIDIAALEAAARG